MPQGEVDALAKVLAGYFRSKQDDLVFWALKIVHLSFQLGITLPLHKEQFSRDVIGVLSRSAATNSELIQISFSLLKDTLFDRVGHFTFVDFQIIFHLLGEYLYIADDVTAPLLFLQRLVASAIVKTEVYDLIGKLFETFYETQDPFFERESKNTIMLFLKNYPIDNLLLVKFTIDLMKHVDLEGDFKRGSVLEFLGLLFEEHGVDFCAEFVG